MALKRKQVGYYCKKGRVLKVYHVYNKKTKKYTRRNMTGSNKKLSTKYRVFKTKKAAVDYLKKMKRKAAKKSKAKKSKAKKTIKRKSPVRKSTAKKSTKFGQSSCYYEVPYFGTMVPSIAKNVSGTPGTGLSSYAWGWPNALGNDQQQGFRTKY